MPGDPLPQRFHPDSLPVDQEFVPAPPLDPASTSEQTAVTVRSLSLNHLGIDHFNVFISVTLVTEWGVLHDFGRISSGIRTSPERSPCLGLSISNPEVGPRSTISLRVGTCRQARTPGRPGVCPHRVISSQTPGGDLQLCFPGMAVFLLLSPLFALIL